MKITDQEIANEICAIADRITTRRIYEAINAGKTKGFPRLPTVDDILTEAKLGQYINCEYTANLCTEIVNFIESMKNTQSA